MLYATCYWKHSFVLSAIPNYCNQYLSRLLTQAFFLHAGHKYLVGSTLAFGATKLLCVCMRVSFSLCVCMCVFSNAIIAEASLRVNTRQLPLQAALRLLQRSFGNKTPCTAHLRYTHHAQTGLRESTQSEIDGSASDAVETHGDSDSTHEEGGDVDDSKSETNRASAAVDTKHTSAVTHKQTNDDDTDNDNELFLGSLLLLCDSGVGDRAHERAASDAVLSRLSIRCLTKIAECSLLR